MEEAADSSLRRQIRRVETYLDGCGMLPFPEPGGERRKELATFLRGQAAAAVDRWIEQVGPALDIPVGQWPEVRGWMENALGRWIAYLEDAEDLGTYRFLRDNARRGFISHFPASRFLCGQIRLGLILQDALRAEASIPLPRRRELEALLIQESYERLLLTTDIFVEAREVELREQEASYRQATDHAPAAIFKVDRDFGTILDCSRVGERLVGLSRAELAGMRIWDLMPPVDRPRVMRVLEETRQRGHSDREDMHLQRRDGEVVPVFFNAGLIEYGDHHFFQVICVDISDRKRLESQLIQSEKMAAIGQLAAGIAHEIRNPLGIIANALYDLGEIVEGDDPDVREDLRIASEEMRRVQEIINNLLEFSRESRAEFEMVDVDDLLRRTLQLLQRSLQTSGVEVRAELGGLPPCLTNQNALRQIFLNLITNAAQAMPKGGELTVRSRRLGGQRIQFEFRDTGVGIPPEQLRDIFNPFFTTKEPGQGTGLGLSVVDSVVRRYRGQIRVESEVGRGTVFFLEFPCPTTETELFGEEVR